jgi:predicted permease
MEVFNLLALKISPLYFIVLLGFVASRYFKIDKTQVSVLLIYLISPFVVFQGAMQAELSLRNMSIPFIWAGIASVIALIFYNASILIWGRKSAKKNIIGLMAGTGNTGYFGLPVALLVFGNEAFPYCILIIMGNIIFEYSLGYYLAARGNFSRKDSLKKLFRLPNLYAFFIGIFANWCGLELGGDLLNFFDYFKGSYSLFGVMMIGMGIAGMKKLVFDYKFISLSLVIRFMVWPVSIFSLVFLDKNLFHFFSSEIIYNCLKLIAFVPLPANAVAFSTELKTHPEKVSVAVLVSTFLALVIIPLALATVF